MEQVILQRAANALFADVEPASPLGKGPIGWILVWPLILLKRLFGGLWVGGTVTITPEHVRFEPNAINVAVHENAHGFLVPYKDIRDVRVERGIGTNIVVLMTPEGERRFRCYKANDAAEAISAARRAATPS